MYCVDVSRTCHQKALLMANRQNWCHGKYSAPEGRIEIEFARDDSYASSQSGGLGHYLGGGAGDVVSPAACYVPHAGHDRLSGFLQTLHLPVDCVGRICGTPCILESLHFQTRCFHTRWVLFGL